MSSMTWCPNCQRYHESNTACQCGGAVVSTDHTQEGLAKAIVAHERLIDVAHMVLSTTTVYTPPELIKAATEALRMVGEIP